MNMEELFKNANSTMEGQVLVPIVMAKLASRGYQPADESEAKFLLEKAAEVRDNLQKGVIQPIPMRAVNQETGELTKEASDKLSQDGLAFADEPFTVDLTKLEGHVKSAAYVMAAVAAEAVESAQATA